MTPEISPFCRVPARLIWNISPLYAAHSICPGNFHRLWLLLFTFHHRQILAWLCPNSTMCSADMSTNILTLPSSSRGTLTKPTSGRSCLTFISIYPVQLEDRIHSIIATHSLKMPTKPTHCWLLENLTIFLTPEYKQRIVQEPPVEREVTRWSSHSEAMLQAALDDVDWDMFRASSSDISEFTDVALSFVNTLTKQATETVTIRTFSNQKPWVDRRIRDAVNH